MDLIIDSHAHLTDPRFAADLDDVLVRAGEAGIGAIVTIGSHVEDSVAAVRLAESVGSIYASVGIHPHAADRADGAAMRAISELAHSARVVAIGETGLDFHYDNSDRDNQRRAFRRHLELARERDLPVVVHARSADDDVIEAIEAEGWGKGILHCFSGGAPLMEAALSLGWYVSFAGMITFPRWEGADLLRRVPLDRLLVETDSPYLAPVPNRGRRNEPAFVRLVVERAATLRGEDPAVVSRATLANARAVFGLLEI